MKIVAMADTHGKHDQVDVPDGDVLIHAGDFTHFGQRCESFVGWYSRLPHKHKIIILGNHEKGGLSDAVTALLGSQHFIFLSKRRKDHVTIDGVTFSLADSASALESDPDVVISHVPPAGILGGAGPRAETIREALRSVEMKVHVFGHIHQGYGRTVQDDTIFINASIVEGSGVRHDPITYELQEPRDPAT